MAAYDLEERTFQFSLRVRDFVRGLPKNDWNNVYCRQLIRSSSSIGANYIEANESLSRKDYYFRVKICRKEAKETRYWLHLLEFDMIFSICAERDLLIKECEELTRIFGSIVSSDKITE